MTRLHRCRSSCRRTRPRRALGKTATMTWRSCLASFCCCIAARDATRRLCLAPRTLDESGRSGTQRIVSDGDDVRRRYRTAIEAAKAADLNQNIERLHLPPFSPFSSNPTRLFSLPLSSSNNRTPSSSPLSYTQPHSTTFSAFKSALPISRPSLSPLSPPLAPTSYSSRKAQPVHVIVPSCVAYDTDSSS